MPTTTASCADRTCSADRALFIDNAHVTHRAIFADAVLIPSRHLFYALVVGYTSACFLLILTGLFHALPWSLWVLALYLLWLEAEQWLWCHMRQQGRLVINCDGEVAWRGQAWRLRCVTVRTPWLLVMQLQRVPEQASNPSLNSSLFSRQWLAIAPDSCCPKTYHRLMLFARYPDGIADCRPAA